MNNTNDSKLTSNSPIAFGIGRAFFYSLIAVFTLQILGAVIQFPAFYYPILNHVLLPFGFGLGLFAAIGILLGTLRTNSQYIIQDFKTKVSITEIILSVVIWISFLPLCEFLTTLIPTDGVLSDLYKNFETSFTMLLDYKVAGFIMVCILAPLLEEVLFRGIILKGMLNYKVNPVLAILISGIIFGMAHLNPWQFVGAGLLGCIFGFVYYRTKSLGLPVALHALNNLLSYTLMMQSNSMEESVFDTSDFISISIFTLFALVFCFILYRITHKKINL